MTKNFQVWNLDISFICKKKNLNSVLQLKLLLIPIIFSILLLGFSFNQDAFAAEFTDSFIVSGQDNNPQGVTFNTDGTKMYVIGQTAAASVYEYNCTAFDVSTCADAASPKDVSGGGTQSADLVFSSDGLKMFTIGSLSDNVVEYNCTAFDVSTCADAASPLGIGGQDGDPVSLLFIMKTPLLVTNCAM